MNNDMEGEMEKVVRDGKVAVLVSPGYGAGWSSWNDLGPAAVFCPALVEAIESGGDVKAVAAEAFPDAYHGGVGSLKIEWVNEGQAFKIDEYDGHESIEFAGGEGWVTA